MRIRKMYASFDRGLSVACGPWIRKICLQNLVSPLGDAALMLADSHGKRENMFATRSDKLSFINEYVEGELLLSLWLEAGATSARY